LKEQCNISRIEPKDLMTTTFLAKEKRTNVN
jgi:hypothetical protein